MVVAQLCLWFCGGTSWSPVTLAFEVSLLVPSDSRYLYPLRVGFVLWYVVYQPFKCCDEPKPEELGGTQLAANSC
ncbi:hypothetical protein Taro_034868 [Colocasia esculenta]|uniref:Secreted protein n=1 Tax=Colocasia esculenta TaxID=4460 RepID=A0A843WBE1_COLES|nr:hypothetical protein [Colocasia esculenta]